METSTGSQTDVYPGTSWSVLDLISMLAKRWPLIAIFTVAVAAFAAIVVASIPSRYTAMTSVLPPQPSSGGALLSQMTNGAGMVSQPASPMTAKYQSDTYIAIFRSHAVEDAVIQQFGLVEKYKAGTISAARAIFEKRSTVVVGLKDGIIRVSVDDSSPQQAATIANGYVEDFRKLATGFALTDAVRRRLFFDNQLEAARKSLADAEQATGAGAAPRSRDKEADSAYVRKLREVKFRETIFQTIADQDELAKLDEGSQGTAFQTLDAATPPDNPSYPHRSSAVILSTLLALLFACLATWLAAGWQALRQDPEDGPRLSRLLSAFRLRREL